MELLNRPINDRFYDLVSSSKSVIRLCAPYVKNEVMEQIYQHKNSSVDVECISNFSLPNFYKKSSDIEAFEVMSNKNDNVFNCQNLHAKLYIFDDRRTIITSANLTHSGFKRNVEYGILIEDSQIVNDSLIDYCRIRDNNNTGRITLKTIQDIKSILDCLPRYHETRIDDFNLVNEIDDILEIEKELITEKLGNWKKAMFFAVDSINHHEFTLSDIYEQESVFTKQFPNNHTVKDSMRRNLQELRDLGLIKFLGNGKYKKLWR